MAATAQARHTERVKKQNLRRPRTLAVTLVALAALLSGCSSPTQPEVTASNIAAQEAGNFCDAMKIASDAAPLASRSLSALYDEIASEEIYAPGANFSAVNAAGAEVVTRGSAYVEALDQVVVGVIQLDCADAELHVAVERHGRAGRDCYVDGVVERAE